MSKKGTVEARLDAEHAEIFRTARAGSIIMDNSLLKFVISFQNAVLTL